MRVINGKIYQRPPGTFKISSKVPTVKHVFLNINGITKTIKQSRLRSMRTVHEWKVVCLADTRLYDDRQVPSLNKSLGVQQSFWSLGHPTMVVQLCYFFVLWVVTYTLQ